MTLPFEIINKIFVYYLDYHHKDVNQHVDFRIGYAKFRLVNKELHKYINDNNEFEEYITFFEDGRNFSHIYLPIFMIIIWSGSAKELCSKFLSTLIWFIILVYYGISFIYIFYDYASKFLLLYLTASIQLLVIYCLHIINFTYCLVLSM